MPPSPPPPPPPVIIDDRAERAARELANLKFQKQSIRFGATYDLYVSNTTAVITRNWKAYRGATDQQLEPEAFYNLIGHPDLAEAYARRRKLAIGGILVGTGLMLGGILYFGSQPDLNCSDGDPNFQTCLDNHDKSFHDAEVTAMILTALGGGALVLGIYYVWHPHPVSENEAKNMAEQYNNGLRQNLGLPVVERHWFHDVHVAPYMTHGEGGLALGGRF